ncbi:hypothetical protein [Paraburkholderia sp. DHOC27]|uniref:hypothetical protein n=1 Tax=Paraburkholderia sp. DHOC27 TaxID=2303330 RepID=UPI000E3BCC3F|nr:hypothetical protein [Paraburkholderia sp. DHOC27]RFU45955.1 hypothetical protein D0B32_20040 [Paraburkholderia sp. DHOC27]
MNSTHFGTASGATRPSSQANSHAVFLHTGYRTAGTWLWSCFRQLDTVTAYYEPLHEMLATIDAAKLASSTADSWHSGHPALDMPYFQEFAHLLQPVDGAADSAASSGSVPGMPGYERRFAVDRFDGATPDGAEQMKAYLNHLIRTAHQQGRVPVFKFCRSLGRLRWFRAAFPEAAHIVVEKNPISQWQSCWQLFAQHRNPHFVAVPLAVLSMNRDVPLVRQTLEALRIELPVMPAPLAGAAGEAPATFEACIDFFKDHVQAISPVQAYRGFVAHWLLTLRDAATQADAIFDCDLAARSPAYLASAERWLEELTGLTPSLGTVRRDGTSDRGCGFDPLEGLQVHLDASRLGRDLVRNGSVEADALSLWTSKLAQATQVMAFGAAANWPRAEMPDGRATRMVDVALIDGAGIDAVLHSELAAAQAALADARSELARVQNSPLWRVWGPLRKLYGAKRRRSARQALRSRAAAATRQSEGKVSA